MLRRVVQTVFLMALLFKKAILPPLLESNTKYPKLDVVGARREETQAVTIAS